MTDDVIIDTFQNLRACRHYATILCAARIVLNLPDGTLGAVQANRDMADALYRRANRAIWPALDSIKRVMEIDTTVDNPTAVLMHAGIELHKQADQQGEPR